MARLIIAGEDNEILPFLEEIRLGGEHEVLGLGPSGPASLTKLYADVMNLPLLQERDEAAWTEEGDFLVSNGMSVGFLPALPCLDLEEARRRFLENPLRKKTAVKADTGPSAESAVRFASPTGDPEGIAPESLLVAEPGVAAAARAAIGADPRDRQALARMMSAEMKDFAWELRREISRSQRHHLSFSLTLFRLVDGNDAFLPADAWRSEPLRSFHKRYGRIHDSWGVSREGILLHLAPETLEQMRLMRQRLVRDLDRCGGLVPGGPWRIREGSALYPQDGDEAYALIEVALMRLERNLAHRGEMES